MATCLQVVKSLGNNLDVWSIAFKPKKNLVQMLV